MDQRTCENCGELLFGAVNRCWKCGADAKIVVKPKLPPIRRGPVQLRPRTVAQLGDNESLDRSIASESFREVLSNVQQVLPWFLSFQLDDKARERCGGISVGLGVLGCLLGIATWWGLLFGVAGLAIGLLGMAAKDRDLATMGLVVSVLAMFVGVMRIGFNVYDMVEAWRIIEDARSEKI